MAVTELCALLVLALPFVLLESRPHLSDKAKHLLHVIFSFVHRDILIRPNNDAQFKVEMISHLHLHYY